MSIGRAILGGTQYLGQDLTNFIKAIANPNGKAVFVAEITAGKHITFWEVHNTDFWKTTLSEPVSVVEVDGVQISKVDSIAEMEANPDSWAQVSGILYLNLDGLDARDFTVQAILNFYFSTDREAEYNGIHYEGRVKSFPNLQLRTEKNFGTVGQIGAGDITFDNADGYFDPYKNLNWDGGKCVLKVGYNTQGKRMGLEDFFPLGTFLNAGHGFKDDRTIFELNLEELKNKIQKQIPFDFYEKADYPNIMEDDVGRPMQRAYGRILGAAPVCIDTQAKRFKVADHAIKAFLGLRISTSNGWENAGFTTRDLSLGEFTCDAWDGESSISVDFDGRINPDGTLMENASDIIKDILQWIGEQDFDLDSFERAKADLDAGGIFNSTDRKTLQKPSFYISEEADAYQIINIINSFVGAFLYSDALGRYHYKVFLPKSRNGMASFTGNDIKDFEEVTEITKKTSKVRGKFAKRLSEDWEQKLFEEKPANQYLHGQNTPILNDEDKMDVMPTSDIEDARYTAQRLLIFEGQPEKRFEFKIVNPEAFLLKPADQIHVETGEKADGTLFFNGTLEIISITYDITERRIEIIAGDLRGWADKPGFWVSDDQLLPPFLEGLAGYADGSIEWDKDWHRLIKDFVKQAWGYWTDNRGFADPEDAESYLVSCYV